MPRPIPGVPSRPPVGAPQQPWANPVPPRRAFPDNNQVPRPLPGGGGGTPPWMGPINDVVGKIGPQMPMPPTTLPQRPGALLPGAVSAPGGGFVPQPYPTQPHGIPGMPPQYVGPGQAPPLPRLGQPGYSPWQGGGNPYGPGAGLPPPAPMPGWGGPMPQPPPQYGGRSTPAALPPPGGPPGGQYKPMMPQGPQYQGPQQAIPLAAQRARGY